MKMTAMHKYACLAVMELAAHYDSPEPVLTREITGRYGVPKFFLHHILLKLNVAGIISSTRGRLGGHMLIPRPEDVTLGQVMGAIDRSVQTRERTGKPATETDVTRVISDVWETAEQVQQDYLNRITFADLVKMWREVRGEG